MDTNCMLTTKDNPYNPFTQFDEWYTYDVLHGYNSCSILGRIARTSPNISDADNRVENAIDEIIKNDALNVFIKVTQPIQ